MANWFIVVSALVTVSSVSASALAQPSATPAPGQPAPPPQQPQQPYPPQQPQQPYPPQPYPPPVYAPPVYQPRPYAYTPPPEPSGQVELIANFAGLGVLAGVTLLDVRDVQQPGLASMVVIGSALGGGATGWMIADRWKITRGQAYTTTLGLGLGLANGALLLSPLGADDSSEEVLPVLLVGSTAGAVGGLILSKQLDFTRGQAVFATNVTLMGFGTSVLAAIMATNDDADVDDNEILTSLAIGIDGGALAGLLIAPRLDWSHRRARMVGAATLVGTFFGTMVGGLVASDTSEDGNRNDPDPDAVAVSMMIGMWGGFAGGILLTRDYAPDPRHAPAGGPPPTAVTPMIGDGRLGVSLAGSF